MGTRKRVFGLDAMRVVAISLVVLSHGVVLWPQNTALSNVLSRTPDGVDLFFGLSGFLVGSMWLRAMHQPNWVTNFWRRWWLRTLPAYYAVLILSYVAVACGWIANDSTLPWWRFATFTQNTVEPLKGFFWESWSLTVQQWSYILLPPLLWLASRVVPRKLPLFLLASLTLVGVGWGFRWGLADIHADAFWWDVWFRKLAPCRVDTLGAGMLVAAWHAVRPASLQRLRWPLAVVGVVVLVFTDNQALDWNDSYAKIGFLGIRALAVALLIPAMNGLTSWPSMGKRAIAHVSAISYSLYLVNLGLIATPMRRVMTERGIEGGWLWFLLYLAVTYVAASALHRWVEKPLMRLR